jgi:tetratricopeptide (TPR) repeat protein
MRCSESSAVLQPAARGFGGDAAPSPRRAIGSERGEGAAAPAKASAKAKVSLVFFALAFFAPLRAAEPWAKVATAHATILTPAGEGAARRWAVEFEQFRRGLQSIVPVPAERLRPVTVVLFRNDRAMAPYLPLENGRPARLGGYFVRTNDLNTIVLSLARDDAATRRVIFHEAVHWHLGAGERPLPLWLDEGLAEVYSTFTVRDERTYSFGDAIPEHVALLRREPLLPLATLLSVGRESLLYNEGTRAGIFYAQAWAFVHFLFYGKNSPGPAAVWRYLALVPALHSGDDAFVAAFGAGYAAIERRLRDYIAGGSYHRHTYTRAHVDPVRELTAGAAAPADLALARGALLLGTRTAEEAERHLGEAAALAPADPRAWELLGQIAIARNDFSTALHVLGRAAAAGSTSHLAYHNLAVARLPGLIGPRLPGAAVDPETMDAAAADFRRALALAPAHLPSYECLAGLMHGLATPQPGDLDLLPRGAALAPGNTLIEAGLGAAEIRQGRAEEGRARLDRLVASRPESSDRGIAFARSVLESEALRAEIDEINRLIAARRYDDVIAIAERALARSLDPAQRQSMEMLRRRMAGYRAIGAATKLANDGELLAAVAQLQALLATEPEPLVRREAERLQREIERLIARQKK